MAVQDLTEEEHEYLCTLSKEPIQETQEMEYYQKLVNLHAAELKLSALRNTFQHYDPVQLASKEPGKCLQGVDAKARHAEEMYRMELMAVQTLELGLNVQERWVAGSQQWKDAVVLVVCCHYQRALDELEALIVSCIFELTRMNMSHTGYKLGKHIRKALHACLQAIRTALECYNSAAALMSPPCSSLTWEEVVEYAFLTDFDLLCDCHQDICKCPWAKPAACLAMDQHFKIQQACEEIKLDIKIQWVVMYMCDEGKFLLAKEEQVYLSNPVLVHQVACYREEYTCYFATHQSWFKKLAKSPLFSGSLLPGTPVDTVLQILLPPTSMDSMDIDEYQTLTSMMETDAQLEEDARLEEETGDDLLVETLEALSLTTH